MARSPSIRRFCLALLGAGILTGGCANTEPPNYYTLSGLQDSATRPAAATSGLTVGVGPITLPQYLDRPQIVRRRSANKLELAEYHKWAEPLDEIFVRVIADNLAALVGTDQVMVLPRRRPAAVDFQVEIDVTQFDTDLTGKTVLKGRWTLYGEDGKRLLVTREAGIVATGGNVRNYESVAAMMSLTVEQLSREIAKAISDFRGRV